VVRIGALDMLGNLPASQIWTLVSPLLSDANRGVRMRAASLLAAVPTASQPPADRTRFESAAAEFIAAQRLNADRPAAVSCQAFPLPSLKRQISSVAAASTIPVTSAAVQANSRMSSRTLVMVRSPCTAPPHAP
jgi:hypothetical protein